MRQIKRRAGKPGSSLSIGYLQKKTRQKVLEQLLSLIQENGIALGSLSIVNSGVFFPEIDKLISVSCKSITVLDLSSNAQAVNLEFMQLLAKAPLQLRQLILKNNKGVTDQAVEVMQQTAAFKGLELLNLSNCSISDKGIKALASSNFAQGLLYLGLARNNDVGTLAALTLEHFPQLLYLDVSFCRIFPQGLQSLVAGRLIDKIEFLNLSACMVAMPEIVIRQQMEDFANQVAKKPAPLVLKHLLLEQLNIDFDILERFRHANFANLSFVDLDYNARLYQKCDAALLKDAQELKNITNFSLRNCQLQLEQLQILMSYFGTQTRKIDVSYNELLKDAGIQMLLKFLAAKKVELEALGLGGCALTDQTLSMMCDLLNLTRVRFLYLRENAFEDKGLSQLSHLKDLPALQYLNLSANKFSTAGFVSLLNSAIVVTVQDLRFSENIRDLNTELLDTIAKYIDNCKNLSTITLGSGYSADMDLPAKIKDRNISIHPFLSDELD